MPRAWVETWLDQYELEENEKAKKLQAENGIKVVTLGRQGRRRISEDRLRFRVGGNHEDRAGARPARFEN